MSDPHWCKVLKETLMSRVPSLHHLVLERECLLLRCNESLFELTLRDGLLSLIVMLKMKLLTRCAGSLYYLLRHPPDSMLKGNLVEGCKSLR